MKIKTSKGFTLIELLVVIGIIGILAAVALTGFRGSTDSARAAKCMTNMRNLATAVQNYGSAVGHYPPAGSFEEKTVGNVYVESPGWISWLSRGKYSGHSSKTSKCGGCSVPSLSSRNIENNEYVLTNGVLWSYVGKSHASYVCPSHSLECQKKENGAFVPQWSYVMSSAFKYDQRKRAIVQRDANRIEFGSLKSADRKLLFAEVPFASVENTEHVGHTMNGGDGTTAVDPILNYDGDGSGLREHIGFNHKSGKNYTAHVAFADGHVAKLMMPKSGSQGDFIELTKWLCQGAEISYNGRAYTREVKASSSDK